MGEAAPQPQGASTRSGGGALPSLTPPPNRGSPGHCLPLVALSSPCAGHPSAAAALLPPFRQLQIFSALPASPPGGEGHRRRFAPPTSHTHRWRGRGSSTSRFIQIRTVPFALRGGTGRWWKKEIIYTLFIYKGGSSLANRGVFVPSLCLTCPPRCALSSSSRLLHPLEWPPVCGDDWYSPCAGFLWHLQGRAGSEGIPHTPLCCVLSIGDTGRAPPLVAS